MWGHHHNFPNLSCKGVHGAFSSEAISSNIKFFHSCAGLLEKQLQALLLPRVMYDGLDKAISEHQQHCTALVISLTH